MKKAQWLMLRDYVIAWILALVVYSLVRTVGTIEVDEIQITTKQSLLMAPIFGSVFGTIFWTTQLIFERLYNQRALLIKLFALRIIAGLITLLVGSMLAFVVFVIVLGSGDVEFVNFMVNRPVFVFYGYILLVDLLVSLFRQVNLMLGPGVMKKLIKGEFYQPREEERVFMFLDLRSSTEMAEKLGHLKYSQMIQDCFNDLSVVAKTEAEIYQYVGDEAVLTWPRQRGLKKHNCINAYYYFKQRIDLREEYYMAKYGHKPFFKAGLNLGKVMVAEVGQTKKEIAYHGDTINTAARIQGKCNEFGSEMLISQELKEALNADEVFEMKLVGDIPLKGKSGNVAIYSVAEES